uniref:Transposase n=1 Tax=Plectus sambesii TaxID=2011161 RepID=A0A914W6K9_9BILA
MALNPRYELPCRETLKRFVARVAHEIKENIKEPMKNSGKVAICVDIWTQRNMVASNLAITAHFYCYKTGKLENVCLAVKQMTTTHSAGVFKAITDEILAEFDLSDDRISRFRADNGSNIVAAF